MPSACERLAARLPEACRGEVSRGELDAHAASCLRCRLELARYERMFRSLAQLGGERADPPPGVLAELLAALECAAARSALRTALNARRVTCAFACLGAAATGLLIARGRSEGRALARAEA